MVEGSLDAERNSLLIPCSYPHEAPWYPRRFRTQLGSLQELLQRPETTIKERLKVWACVCVCVKSV